MDAGVTQVIRGADLLTSTPRQIYLYGALRQQPPAYHHLPLALGADAKKLSKRDGRSACITSANGSSALWHALAFLGQQPPAELRQAPAPEQLAWARRTFQPELIPQNSRPAPRL
jgi:glutamyl-Q tRNA(Asp) synthetase